jgi:hypothetical protein
VNYELDAELAPAIAALTAQATEAPAPARGDWQAVREAAAAGLAYMATLTPASSGVTLIPPSGPYDAMRSSRFGLLLLLLPLLLLPLLVLV